MHTYPQLPTLELNTCFIHTGVLRRGIYFPELLLYAFIKVSNLPVLHIAIITGLGFCAVVTCFECAKYLLEPPPVGEDMFHKLEPKDDVS